MMNPQCGCDDCFDARLLLDQDEVSPGAYLDDFGNDSSGAEEDTLP